MAQRTTFAKLQRERAKQAKAEAKRSKRQGTDPAPKRDTSGPPPRKQTMEEMIWAEVQAEKEAAAKAKADAEAKKAE